MTNKIFKMSWVTWTLKVGNSEGVLIPHTFARMLNKKKKYKFSIEEVE